MLVNEHHELFQLSVVANFSGNVQASGFKNFRRSLTVYGCSAFSQKRKK
jgi:hypothetical protein